jgi:hypothetical protein
MIISVVERQNKKNEKPMFYGMQNRGQVMPMVSYGILELR